MQSEKLVVSRKFCKQFCTVLAWLEGDQENHASLPSSKISLNVASLIVVTKSKLEEKLQKKYSELVNLLQLTSDTRESKHMPSFISLLNHHWSYMSDSITAHPHPLPIVMEGHSALLVLFFSVKIY